jgi:soluble lytic murein transglycosylase-like protein
MRMHVLRQSCVRAAFALVGIAIALPAQAQIYSFKDANGNLVLSNVRHEAGAAVRRATAPEAEAVRDTRVTATDQRRAYDDLIVEHAQRNGIRPDLVRAVVKVESAFDPNARSAKGAMGLMQLMPATMKEFGVTNAYNPSENVRAGVAYLRTLSTATRTTKSSRSRPITPARARSTNTARPSLPTLKRETTSRR